MSMSKKKEKKLSKYMKVPINMMMKAREFYIRSMNQLSTHDLVLGNSMGFGIPVCHVSALPRSFSASHSVRAEENRVAVLVRAASARNVSVDAWHGPPVLRKTKSSKSYGGPGGDHRFERIDETSPLISFGSNQKMLRRSKSYGVVKYT